MVEDTYRSTGVIGIRAIEQYQDVFEIRADMVKGAFPLSASDRTRVSLSSPVALAYQYDSADFAIVDHGPKGSSLRIETSLLF